jgi:hypothetical protein
MAKLRQRLLESKAHEGLGGPPNNWQHSPAYKGCNRGHSSGVAEYGISFQNDAHDVGLWVRYDEENRQHWDAIMSTEHFRKMALWYLWRWAWGEVFGLRRWLYYKDLSRRMKPYWKAMRERDQDHA